MYYQKIYNELINRSKNRPLMDTELYEKHHILPKSMGGNNHKDNIVKLTIREHFIAHLLLVKITKNQPKNHKKMIYALWWMSKTHNKKNNYKVNSWAYYYARKKFIESNVNSDPERKKKYRENRLAGLYKYNDKLMGRTLRQTIKSMPRQELLDRMKKSAGSCDHIKRGISISIGKGSKLLLLKIDGEAEEFHSYDDVISITGYTYDHIKYRIKRYKGLLVNGNTVKYIKKYKQNYKKKRT